MEVARGIDRVTGGIVNWYVIQEGGRLTLVDAGAPKDWDLLIRTLGSLGRSLDDVEAVLLTHAHSDHTGFAERARSEGGVTVRIHSEDVDVARGGKPGKNDRGIAPYLLRAETWRTTFSLLRRSGVKIVPIKEVSSFADGEALDVPGHPTVVHVPGHTPGSAALHLAGRDVLFTGDALVLRNPLTGRVGPQVMPGALNRSTDQALGSLARLEDLPAHTVLPGHGEPFTEGIREAVRLARQAGPS